MKRKSLESHTSSALRDDRVTDYVILNIHQKPKTIAFPVKWQKVIEVKASESPEAAGEEGK